MLKAAPGMVGPPHGTWQVNSLSYQSVLSSPGTGVESNKSHHQKQKSKTFGESQVVSSWFTITIEKNSAECQDTPTS